MERNENFRKRKKTNKNEDRFLKIHLFKSHQKFNYSVNSIIVLRVRSLPTSKYGIYINSVAINIVTHYGSFRRNRRIFHNAFRLTFEPKWFSPSYNYTQIDPANAAIAAANFNSKEHEASYLDNDSYLLCLRDRKVLRYLGIIDFLISRRGGQGFPSLVFRSQHPRAFPLGENQRASSAAGTLLMMLTYTSFFYCNKPRECQHPIYSSERGICMGCLESPNVLLTADPSVDLERFLSVNKKLSKQFLSN